MIKAIVFDFFGVLITDALSEMVVKLRETDAAKADRIVDLVKQASKGTLGRIEGRLAVAAELDLTLDEYSNIMKSNEIRNHDLLKFIKSVRKNYKTALLSNVSCGGLEVRFPGDELYEYFDVVVSSGDVGLAKPEIEIYELAANNLGVNINECVMIDDNKSYYQGAVAAGMHAILYKSNKQLQADLAKILKHNT